MVAPLPPFPVTEALCAMKDCENPGIWQPILLLRHWSSPAEAPAILRCAICDACKPKCTVDDFLTDESFEMIGDGMNQVGKARPTRKLTRLDWRRIGADN